MTCTAYIFLSIVLVSMFGYQFIMKDLKGEFNDDGKLIVPPTLHEKVMGYGVTAGYSGIVIVFGTLYKKLATIQTQNENYQFQKQYDDALINRLFQFNFFNFYMPMLLVAFYTRKYDDLFMMMLSQMAFKQISMNLIEWFLPIITTRKKMVAVREEYDTIIRPYEELQDGEMMDTPNSLDQTQSNDQGSVRKYQAFRDNVMAAEKPDILAHYMELIVQFGYIVLFSEVFPLAALMSYISNYIQMQSQINNLGYSRRFKAEVSNGIGNWLTCLQILTQFSIFTSCACIYFTSRTFRNLLVHGEAYEGISALSDPFEMVQFFLIVVVVEHVVMVTKILLEMIIEDVPQSVVNGERERNAIIQKFNDKSLT